MKKKCLELPGRLVAAAVARIVSRTRPFRILMTENTELRNRRDALLVEKKHLTDINQKLNDELSALKAKDKERKVLEKKRREKKEKVSGGTPQ